MFDLSHWEGSSFYKCVCVCVCVCAGVCVFTRGDPDIIRSNECLGR